MSERIKESWKVKDKRSQHVSSLSSFSSTCNQISDFQHGWSFSMEEVGHTPVKEEKEEEVYSYRLNFPKNAESSNMYSSFQVKHSPESHEHCSSVSSQDSPVKFWEENNELSVLDFLETQFQEQESSVDMKNYVSERLRILMRIMENNARKVRRNLKHKIRSSGTKEIIKRFKGITNEYSFTNIDYPVFERYSNETKLHTDFQSNENLVPYSSLLKSICQKELVALRCTDNPSKTQIFRPLDPEEVKYPYAGILQSFCCKTKEKDDVNTWHCTRSMRKRKNLSDILTIGDIMKEIKYPISNSAVVDVEGKGCSCVFSKKLLSAVKKSKKDIDSSGPLSHSSVGAVLQETLSGTGDAYLPSEFYSCVLLQKLSQEAVLGIRQEEDTLEDGYKGSQISRIKLSKIQRTPSRSSSPDVFEMSGDLKFSSHFVDTSRSLLEEYLQNQADVKNNFKRASASSDNDLKESSVSSSRLLQLLARRSSKELESYMHIKENQILPSNKQSEHFQNDFVSSSSFSNLKKESNENASSVLQVLLQQTSSRSFTEDDRVNETIPRIDSEFLFSRMLQNFKLQVEAKQPQGDCKDNQDNLTVAEVLRGMGGSPEHHPRSREEESSCDRLVVPSLNGRCLTVSEITKIPHGRQKYEEEEKNFECDICCLQFTSHSDLSNHQTIFHMSEATLNTCPESEEGIVSLILHDRLKAQ
ncbi:uncharacterized protein LOC143020062 [Oratosquilla oratoria]|uniref:uncharacterized protein LOC143020062 n=1 Tax=Oratosquilla oratoria TaxID=337810 RepID=UPI003F7663AC